MSGEPKYIDLQINGYAGVDFNKDDLAEADLHTACERLREDGVAGILATIITDEIPQMEKQLQRIAAIRRQDRLVQEVIWGIHLEGPFLNETPGYRGAHPADAIRPAEVDVLKRLLDAADGLVRLATLAPERDPGLKVVRHLADRRILVSAGHCNPSLDELQAAIDAGLSMFTHLGNGCPLLLDRHDNIIQRVLSLRERLTICFIADGIHIPPLALKNYLQLTGFDRTLVVTDAMAATRMKPGIYSLGSQSVVVDENLIARPPNGLHLAGSTATMPRMAEFLHRRVGLSEDQIKRLTYDNPHALMNPPTDVSNIPER